MSFLRMQESPKPNEQEIPAFAGITISYFLEPSLISTIKHLISKMG